ncbi:hypothetical protein PsorP6_002614 [Peronosclerospora sorghi]|uniref:Uncharacterized protein n=1 Tax=Peronosclerospora sorghi TaxID=230839 RepID=A0ACC0WRE1_9STRA|nr:hypothetical protein PsorP6_002614 [Peronosclerospora sorghi]
MTRLGVRHGNLVLLDEHGHLATRALVMTGDKRVQVLRGGLQRILLPLGLMLLQKAGIKRGDAFILLLDNDRKSVACILAAMHLQCVCCLICKNRSALLEHVKRETGITKVLSVNDATSSVDVQDDVNPLAVQDSTYTIPWLPDDEISTNGCVCLLTSGSVGKPKIVACTWDHMVLQGKLMHQHVVPMRPTRIICCTSISHAFSINAIFSLFTSPYDLESELCFASSAVGLYSLLTQQSDLFTFIYGTPGIYTALAAMPPAPLHADVPYCAGARLSLSLFRKMRDKYGLQLMQNYGSTETGNITAWFLCGKSFDGESKELESNENLLYVGSVWPGVEASMKDNGEITITTPWQSKGYVTACTLHRFLGTYHTSDIGIITKEKDGVSCIWLQKRLRPNVHVKWRDQRIAYLPEEIEAVLIAHPCISDVLVLTQNKADRDQGIIKVRVVLNDGAFPDVLDIKELCNDRNLPALRDALAIEFANYLPCSPAGKLVYAAPILL